MEKNTKKTDTEERKEEMEQQLTTNGSKVSNAVKIIAILVVLFLIGYVVGTIVKKVTYKAENPIATIEVENLITTFKSFQHIIQADIPALDDVEGIGEIRARAIKRSIKRMQEQFLFDNLSL